MTMNRRHHRKEQGYSLLETIVSMSVFLLVLFAIYIVLESSQSIYAKGEGKVDVQQRARAAMDQISTLLRNAGYFPENFDANPVNNLANPVPIQVATDNALAIYGDADGTGTSNVFLFCLNGTSLIRVRAAVGTPAAYTCNQGQVLGLNVTNPRFAYFDANNNPIPNPPTPPYQLDGEGLGPVPAVPLFASTVQRGAVRRVVITLTATENVPGQQPQIYTLTSNVRLRNLN
jgi:type II secretory pathway pseudopilin PulG